MKKVELLSPVGNKEMLYQAVFNGCDAVYLSGNNYGARKYADNFNNEELIEAIKFCHLYGVKVYVTVNTLIYNDEVESLLEYVEFLHKNNVDALIMQDLGMINLVCKKFPNLEVHASTQAHNHNDYGIKYLESLGVKRVVLAREMTLEEINNVNTTLEKEVFVYGALCVCYSGCCLFSSLNGGRSGNRGECVGSCRLPYKIMQNDKIINGNGDYPLSLREFNTINNLKEILDSNIDSLKIEGRMKSPSYVGYVTRLYRILIDKYYNHEEMTISNEEYNNLKKLYNRKFTTGYLFNDKNIANIKTSNHQGIKIGEVIKVTSRYIWIKITDDLLNQEDAIRFSNSNKGMVVNKLYNEKELLTNSIKKGSICLVDNKVELKEKDIVLKTVDKKLNDELLKLPERKIPIKFTCKFLFNKEFEIKVSDGKNEITEKGNIVVNALKHEVTEMDIKRQLEKVGNTPFKIIDTKIEKDNNIFVNLKDINEVRRKVLDKLVDTRKNTVVHDFIKLEFNETNTYKVNNDIEITVLVNDEKQLLTCLENKVDKIITSNINLYKKYKSENIYLKLPRVNMKYPFYENENLLVSEIGSINKYKNNNLLLGDYPLNVTNDYTKDLLLKDLERVTLSVEVDDTKLNTFKNFNNLELVIYSRPELMVMKYCPIKQYFGKCMECNRVNNNYYLIDKNNNKYPIIQEKCLTKILHYKTIDKISNINNYLNLGIKKFRIDLFKEDEDTVKKILKQIKNATLR